jgi:hypothetical protein
MKVRSGKLIKHSEKKSFTLVIFFILSTCTIYAQSITDTLKKKKWTTHFQFTTISQIHSGFKSPYSGENSIADSVEPFATSLTSTLFVGRKLWKGAAFYFNPEVSGGRGLSFTKGVAGALNGETYRVGDAAPEPFVARAYLQQHFALGQTYETVEDDVNQVADKIPEKRITVTVGKFSVSDFFDDNSYSKDPRTQFLNWSIWANGAWDYPANTKGYTYGIVAEIIKPLWSIRVSSVAVPRIANFHLMQYKIPKAHSETIEVDHSISINKKHGDVRFIVSNTRSKAPSYAEGLNAIAANDTFLLNVIAGNEENDQYGGKKFGLGLNIEQELTSEIGFFSRIGWNDGKFVSWAFTEIDQTFTAGLSFKGKLWKRSEDVFGIATAFNGISSGHRNFLKDGGYGFIIGDGTLTYGSESIIEWFYNAKLFNSFWVSLDYQFINNPGYNKDRGPVHVFGIRGHVEF